ncbi:natriuretic peptides A-like [Emydura macquarii macquarii]|uniref:natriuretic peptides A-like n=1 Tax=Emydura macquarii macquarii TaxID=1129001 RepID=UPI00352AF9D2
MKGAALGFWASLLLLLQGPAGGHPLSRTYTSQELRTLQDLVELLMEKTPREAGELREPEHLDYGGEEDDPAWELAEPQSSPSPGHPVPPGEAGSQWRNLFASLRRMRHFSGCFGTRIDRIGSQTGLGCSLAQARSWQRRWRS